MNNQLTPERIKELRAIMDGTSDVFRNAAPRTIKAMIPIVATQSLPQALDTIEAQQRRIEELEAALNPFANEASEYDQGQFEDRDSPYFNTFNIGQLRTARAALNHKEPAA